jgi:hypothetical protein
VVVQACVRLVSGLQRRHLRRGTRDAHATTHTHTHTHTRCSRLAHLPLQALPPERECRAAAALRCHVPPLAAVVVGVKHKAALIIACGVGCGVRACGGGSAVSRQCGVRCQLQRLRRCCAATLHCRRCASRRPHM